MAQEKDLSRSPQKLSKQIKAMKKITEWDFNSILDILFVSHYKKKYMGLLQKGNCWISSNTKI